MPKSWHNLHKRLKPICVATGKDVVVHVGETQPRVETRTCYNYNKVGNISADCRGKKKKDGGSVHKDGAHMTLAVVDDREIVQDQWILDSGLSLHLVNDTRLLESSRDRDSELEHKEFKLVYVDGLRSLVLSKTGAAVLDVQMDNHVLVIQAGSKRSSKESHGVIMAVINEEASADADIEVQAETLLQFHRYRSFFKRHDRAYSEGPKMSDAVKW
uniref:AlNc14C572G12183 protein n=1 Tax=Albugo laibachii Nc14 TaxID=890382 RepID=F0X188_9STRA|nr:AlNc14C572G12183 [Albugo laibachii Nc14]|eukprot:CCA27547.1 AlNc14C572G12183 [Albugo laibachii Nc14]